MKDIGKILPLLNSLGEERLETLVGAKKRNYKDYNEDVSVKEQMIPIHLYIGTEISNFDYKDMRYVTRINTLFSRATGINITCKQTDNYGVMNNSTGLNDVEKEIFYTFEKIIKDYDSLPKEKKSTTWVTNEINKNLTKDSRILVLIWKDFMIG